MRDALSRSLKQFPFMRKLAFFGGRGDPLKKRILPHHALLPSFSYCLANNQRSYPEKSLQPGKVSLFYALVAGFIRGTLRVQ